MPLRQENGSAAADRVLKTITMPIDNVLLINLTLSVLTPSLSPANAYVQIGIMAGGTAQGNIASILGAGYVGTNSSVSWNGKFKGSPEQYVFANIRSDAAAEFKLAILSE